MDAPAGLFVLWIPSAELLKGYRVKFSDISAVISRMVAEQMDTLLLIHGTAYVRNTEGHDGRECFAYF